ncbi:unnamed protein product [Ascophyllum nodosum]
MDAGGDRQGLRAAAIKAAVGSGVPEAVKELLEGNSNSEAVQLLTATYDGGPTSCTAASVVDDDDFLFRGANPVLHAARLGNPGMVTTVLQALRTRVSSQKVKELLMATDDHGRMPLSMAARSGDKVSFEAFLVELRKELDEDELTSVMQTVDARGRSLLALAARSGSADLLEAVLEALTEELSDSHSQAKSMITSQDHDRCSLLGLAALGGGKECFKSVVDVLKEELPEDNDRLMDMMRSTDRHGRSLLALAAMSGSKETFATVLSILVDELGEDKVREMLQWKDAMNRSLRAQAAVGGRGVLGAAQAALSGKRDLEEEFGESSDIKMITAEYRNWLRFRPPAKPSESKLEEYRGGNNWAGLYPGLNEPRHWDEGFRSFLIKYGMINHVSYDVYVKPRGAIDDVEGHRGTSRFRQDLDAFTRKGLKFSYVNREGDVYEEYDFTKDYHVIGNLVCSPRSAVIKDEENNWFGFVMLSNDLKEMVIVFRGTQSTMEWVMNAKLYQERLDGDETTNRINFFLSSQNRLCHAGFQQLYREAPENGESPKETIYRLMKEHVDTLEFVTTVGHSLGGAMCQLCAVDLVNKGAMGHIPVVPVLAIAWAAPKVANACLARWADSMHPMLRVLRIKHANDLVTKIPPGITSKRSSMGGYKHLGTPFKLSNEHLLENKIIKRDSTNNSNHNLQAYMHNIDPSRDKALMNKYGDIIGEKYRDEHNISVMWHALSYPRTIYEA